VLFDDLRIGKCFDDQISATLHLRPDSVSLLTLATDENDGNSLCLSIRLQGTNGGVAVEVGHENIQENQIRLL
jgi:hypothetical protein